VIAAYEPVLLGYEPGPWLKNLKRFLVSVIALSNRSAMENARPSLAVFNSTSLDGVDAMMVKPGISQQEANSDGLVFETISAIARWPTCHLGA
jgi:hypothetical protein